MQFHSTFKQILNQVLELCTKFSSHIFFEDMTQLNAISSHL